MNGPRQPTRIKSRKKAALQAVRRPKPRPVLAPGQRPPAEVTRDLFLVWRMPRLGMNNPQRQRRPSVA